MHTFACDEHLLLKLVGSTIEEVSVKEWVWKDAVLGVLEWRVGQSGLKCFDAYLVTLEHQTVIPREPPFILWSNEV